jgi:hypothetical protein
MHGPRAARKRGSVGGGGGRSRTLRRSVRESAATATGVLETPTQYVQEGDREESSLKKKTTVLWPRRGRRELRQRCWSFFDGSCRSRTASIGYASCSSPGVSTPARFGGENRTRLQDPDEVQGGALKGESSDPWPTAASCAAGWDRRWKLPSSPQDGDGSLRGVFSHGFPPHSLEIHMSSLSSRQDLEASLPWGGAAAVAAAQPRSSPRRRSGRSEPQVAPRKRGVRVRILPYPAPEMRYPLSR